MNQPMVQSEDPVEAAVSRVVLRGPARVLVSRDGDATSPDRAWRTHRVRPSLCFVREDGWTIGAPGHLARAAYRLWPERWACVVWARSRRAVPIAEFCRNMGWPR